MATKNIKTIRILGIDTSCDDTAISVLKIRSTKHEIRNKFELPNFEIFSNVISSQVKLHAKYGGVYPMLAKREHQKNLPLVFNRATKGIKIADIDMVAVTNGPGLEPCLWQGINFAKELAEKLLPAGRQGKIPLIPVNHIEAHILANLLNAKLIFPAVCLVVSGGHTQIILMRGIGKYKLLGETRDDAAGECFDKAARILGLGYPGGPIISNLAAKNIGRQTSVKLPRPMMYTKDYDFSFSGLKTAVLYEFQKRPTKIRKSKKYIIEMCYEIQQAIIDVLIKKTIKAVKDFKVKSIILGGGVAANTELRKQFDHKLKTINYKLKFFVPPKIICTDNAAMVAVAAYFHKNKKTDLRKLKADGNLKIC